MKLPLFIFIACAFSSCLHTTSKEEKEALSRVKKEFSSSKVLVQRVAKVDGALKVTLDLEESDMAPTEEEAKKALTHLQNRVVTLLSDIDLPILCELSIGWEGKALKGRVVSIDCLGEKIHLVYEQQGNFEAHPF